MNSPLPLHTLAAVGVAVPGFVDPARGLLRLSSISSRGSGESLGPLLHAAGRIPVLFHNDMHAVAQWWRLTHADDTEQVLLVGIDDGRIGGVMAEARAAGIKGTPSLFLNGRPLVLLDLSEEGLEFTLQDEGQDLLLTVRVNEISPYFSDWQRNPNPAQIDVVNVFQRAHSVYMDARIDKDQQRAAYTKDGAWRQLGLPPISIPATASFTIPGRQIPFFDPSLSSSQRDQLIGLEGPGLEAQLNGALPEGDYQLCIQLRNMSDDHISGQYQCSDPFHIQLPPPPELLQPGDGEHSDPDGPLGQFGPSLVANHQLEDRRKLIEGYALLAACRGDRYCSPAVAGQDRERHE